MRPPFGALLKYYHTRDVKVNLLRVYLILRSRAPQGAPPECVSVDFPTEIWHNISVMKILIRLAKEAKQYKIHYLIGILAVMVTTGVSLTAPKILSSMTGIVSAGVTEEGVKKIAVYAGVLAALYLVKWLSRFLSTYLLHVAAWKLVNNTRVKLYDHIQMSSMSFFKDKQTGDLLSRVVNDTSNFEMLYAHVIPEFITNILTFAGVFVILLVMNWKLASVTAVVIPLVAAACIYYGKKVRPNFKAAQRLVGDISAEIQDNISGVYEIQTFGQEAQEHAHVAERAEKHTVAILKALKTSGIFHPLIDFVSSMGTVLVVGVGGYLAYKNQVDVEDIVAFLLYLSLFFGPMENLARLVENAQTAYASGERTVQILDAPIEIQDAPDAVDIGKARGDIAFDDVSFDYGDGREVLHHVSFECKAGEMIAFVGATGAGKTTITKLIPRFYEPTSGEVKLDGVNVKDITLRSLRGNIAPVLQDTFLFNGTVAENIAYANPSAKFDEIVAAATKAHIHEEILEMPDGYMTKVGERGMRLSGGQKQRLAIARAILRDAPVIILDEATASVDSETERYIQQAINEINGKHTIVAVAHRLSTIKNADKIVVLKDGEIAESGTHDELMEAGGIYRDLFLKSSGGE